RRCHAGRHAQLPDRLAGPRGAGGAAGPLARDELLQRGAHPYPVRAAATAVDPALQRPEPPAGATALDRFPAGTAPLTGAARQDTGSSTNTGMTRDVLAW